MASELRLLLDEREIREVLVRYVRAADHLDYEALRSCYHSDATEDRGRFKGGIDGFIEWIQQTLNGLESTWHMLGTPAIELDGDRAWVETYCLGVQRHRSVEDNLGGASVDRLGPYRLIDRFERRDGEWRIARRVAVYEPGISVASTGSRLLGTGSRRDVHDAAYIRD
jgi:SnoaL-like domain